MMLEKETWQPLSPAAIKTVNLAGLLGDGAPVLHASPVGLPRGADSCLSPSVAEQGLGRSNENQAGFAVWLERGNPFGDKKMPFTNNDANQASKHMQQKLAGVVETPSMSNGSAMGQDSHHSDEVEEDENEDLLADFIDEDSQLPSRVYKGFKHSSQAHIVDDESILLTGSAVGILRQSQNFSLDISGYWTDCISQCFDCLVICDG